MQTIKKMKRSIEQETSAKRDELDHIEYQSKKMKRSIEQETSEKSDKLDHVEYHNHDQAPFSDDALELIMSFLWARFLALSCPYVSRQWYRVMRERFENQFAIRDKKSWTRFVSPEYDRYNSSISLFLSGYDYTTNMSKIQGRANIKRLNIQCRIVRNIEQIRTLDNLESIRLFRCSINDQSIWSISGLKKLKRIDISSMELSENNDENGGDSNADPSGLTMLDRLSVTYSKISDSSLFNIAKLTQISYLDLSGSHFYGYVDKWSEHISKLTNLTHLNLACTGLVDDDMVNISKIAGLVMLDISRGDISYRGFSFLSCLKNLTHLEANGTFVGEDACLHMRDMSSLKILSLEFSLIGDEVCHALSHLSGLRRLNVSNNNVVGKNFSHLCSMSNLDSLGVMGCSIDSESAKQIERLENLRHLEISIDDKRKAFLSGKRLETLCISKGLYNEVSVSFESIQGFYNMDRLTSLSLKENRMTCAHAKELSRLTQLTKLDVSNNLLGAEGARQISKMEALIHLDISMNDIKGEGLKSLVLDLKNLWHLDISYCSIGNESIEHIAQADNIGSLRCVCNRINKEGKTTIRLMKNIVSLEI